MTTENDFDAKLADLKAFRAEFDKLGYLWSDDNIAKAYLGWKLFSRRHSLPAMEAEAHLQTLIGQYWDVAYAEGAERREHDTQAGDAQQVLSQINDAIRRLRYADKPTASNAGEREEFEAWSLTYHEHVDEWTGARYRSDVWEDMWLAFQAGRAALASKPPAGDTVEDPDGAALRAAVEYGLHIGVEENTISAWHRDVFGNFQTEVRGDDSMGAAHRAIDRAVKVLLRRKS